MTDTSTIYRLTTVEQRLLWLSCWIIHHSNTLRPKNDGEGPATSADVATRRFVPSLVLATTP